MTTLSKVIVAGLAGLTFSLVAGAQETAGAAVAQAAQPKSDTISNSAAVYATFQSDVTDIRDRPFSSAGDVDSALNNLGGHNADKLSSGWIAYSALIASQNPDYRAAVRDIESFYGRDVLERGLRNDVRYARTLSGGDQAIASALSAVNADERRLHSAASMVKEQAYSLQGSGWAKAKIGNSGALANKLSSAAQIGRPAAATMTAALSASDIDTILAQAGSSGAPSLWEGVSGAASSVRFPTVRTSYGTSRVRVAPGKEPIADRIATLAAYRVIGANASSAGTIHTAMAERGTSRCLKTAHLNLQQCVAAAHQQFEVPFCIGEHALADVGQCIGEVTQ